MKARALAATLAALILAAPVAAHPIEVNVPNSDPDALATYVTEYRAQDEALGLAIGAYFASDAGTIQAAGEELRAGVIYSQEHMASLDVRPCFATLDETVHAAYDGMVRALQPGVSPALAGLEWQHTGAILKLIDPEILAAVQLCGV
jgi:hypothetical protein